MTRLAAKPTDCKKDAAASMKSSKRDKLEQQKEGKGAKHDAEIRSLPSGTAFFDTSVTSTPLAALNEAPGQRSGNPEVSFCDETGAAKTAKEPASKVEAAGAEAALIAKTRNWSERYISANCKNIQISDY